MKLLPIFRTLTKNDWHWLAKFAESPIYNRHATVTRLLEWYRKKSATHTSEPSSENLHRVLFADTPFDAARVHHTSNYLLRLTEEYLAWDTWWLDESERQYALLRATRQRGLHRHFREVLARLERLRQAQPLRHAAHHRLSYQLALEAYHQSLDLGRGEVGQLQQLANEHDVAFVAEKLRNACGLASRSRLLPTDFDFGLLPAVLDFVAQRPALLELPAVAAYYHGYRTLEQPHDATHFFALKKLLDTSYERFPLAELRGLYLLAINFCIPRINLREAAWLHEVFDLYKKGLALGIFLENNQMSRFTYTNIAFAALRLGEFEWTYEYLHAYRDYLAEEHREGVFSFNLARFFCEKGDFDRAMPLLLRMDFDDLSHNLTAKAMLLRMHYEMHSYDALESLLHSLATYLRRQRQVSEQQRTAYTNLIRLVRRVVTLSPRDRAGRQALRSEVEQTALVAEKDWLLRMLG
jgi:hypothetical protein